MIVAEAFLCGRLNPIHLISKLFLTVVRCSGLYRFTAQKNLTQPSIKLDHRVEKSQESDDSLRLYKLKFQNTVYRPAIKYRNSVKAERNIFCRIP